MDGLLPGPRDRYLIAKDALVRAAGVREENGDDKGSGSRFWSLVPGHLSLFSGYKPSVIGG
jgi:hypothetical protein